MADQVTLPQRYILCTQTQATLFCSLSKGNTFSIRRDKLLLLPSECFLTSVEVWWKTLTLKASNQSFSWRKPFFTYLYKSLNILKQVYFSLDTQMCLLNASIEINLCLGSLLTDQCESRSRFVRSSIHHKQCNATAASLLSDNKHCSHGYKRPSWHKYWLKSARGHITAAVFSFRWITASTTSLDIWVTLFGIRA